MCAYGATVVLGPSAGLQNLLWNLYLQGDAVQARCCGGGFSLHTCLFFCGVFCSGFHSVFDDLSFTPSSRTWL